MRLRNILLSVLGVVMLAGAALPADAQYYHHRHHRYYHHRHYYHHHYHHY